MKIGCKWWLSHLLFFSSFVLLYLGMLGVDFWYLLYSYPKVNSSISKYCKVLLSIVEHQKELSSIVEHWKVLYKSKKLCKIVIKQVAVFLMLESPATWWTCSPYQNESIPHFFCIFPTSFLGNPKFSGSFFLKQPFSWDWLVEFHWNFARILAQLVCINSDTKRNGSIIFIFFQTLIVHDCMSP